MKLFLALITFAFISGISVAQNDITELKSNLKKNKTEAKAQLDGLRYDGSKTTYVIAKGEKVYKEIEVVLFLRENYTLIINGKASPSKTTIRFFDKPSYDPNRVLLKEIKAADGKVTKQDTKELSATFENFTGGEERLRSVYIEYEFKKTKELTRGGMVLVLGY